MQSNFIGTDFHVYNDGARDAPPAAAPRPSTMSTAASTATAASTLPPTGLGAPAATPDSAPPVDSDSSAQAAGSHRAGVGSGVVSTSFDSRKAPRAELAVVQYHMNVMSTKGPRKMTVGIPYVDCDTNEATVWTHESMLGWCAPRFANLSAFLWGEAVGCRF